MFRSYYPALTLLSLVAFLSGCATSQPKSTLVEPIITISPRLSVVQMPTTIASEVRTQPITFLILHHTASGLQSALKTLDGTSKGHKVGVHYVVSAEPSARIFRLSPESLATYHAGPSAWGKFTALNQSSVGIEIVNLDGNVHPYPKSQVDAVLTLAQHIIATNHIAAENVLAHSDIAVGRKIDPGALFPWEYLAANGVGAWPDAKDVAVARILLKSKKPTADEVRLLLKTYGYQLVDNTDATLKLALEAFQRHFRPAKVDGLIDDEGVAILQSLIKKYRTPPRPVPSPARSKKT